MQTYSDYYEKLLRDMIQDAIDRLTLSLTAGYGINDYAQYKQQVGQIIGLRAALEMCDEARDEANKAMR
jgi:hypothetical protein